MEHESPVLQLTCLQNASYWHNHFYSKQMDCTRSRATTPCKDFHRMTSGAPTATELAPTLLAIPEPCLLAVL